MNKLPLQCRGTKKKLAYIDKDGIYFMCKICKIEHKIPRAEIVKMWTQFDKQEVPILAGSGSR